MRFAVAAALLMFHAGQVIQAADEDLSAYKPLMQAAKEAYDTMEAAIDDGDAIAARQSAEELSQQMSKIVEFWAGRGVANAQEYATNVKSSAEEVAAKVAASDFVGAKAAEEQASQNCKSCHQAHRKFSLGGWKIK